MKSFQKFLGEGVERIAQYGNYYAISLVFRGSTRTIQMFFPQRGRPMKKDVQSEVEKVYPGAKVIYFYPAVKNPSEPLFMVNP